MRSGSPLNARLQMRTFEQTFEFNFPKGILSYAQRAAAFIIIPKELRVSPAVFRRTFR